MDEWYAENLVCPVERTRLRPEGNALVADSGRSYPVVDGVPVMLVEEDEQTIGVANASLTRAKDPGAADPRAPDFYLESLGISENDKEALVEIAARGDWKIDPVVSVIVAATNGISYLHLVGQLETYPIPEIRLPEGRGRTLLDIGCNWGRWSIAAARKGYDVVGIDPSLGAVMAARRVARQLGLPIRFVVGDARRLPFPAGSFDTAFSYSVLQHLSKPNVRLALAEIGRVLRDGGTSLIQMPNWLGIRSLYHQARRGFREPRQFEVRYWSVPELRRAFGEEVGPSKVTVDCYFGLGLQKSDIHLMPPYLRTAVRVSEALRQASRVVGALTYAADSVYVESTAAHDVRRARRTALPEAVA